MAQDPTTWEFKGRVMGWEGAWPTGELQIQNFGLKYIEKFSKTFSVAEISELPTPPAQFFSECQESLGTIIFGISTKFHEFKKKVDLIRQF